MANRTWVSVTGVASAAASWGGGALPIDGDVVTFDKRYSQIAPTSGLDFSGVSFDLLIDPNWNLPIGSANNPLKAEATVIRHFGSATLFYQSANSGAAANTPDVFINSRAKGPAAVFSTNGTSRFYRAVVEDGRVVFDTSAIPYWVTVGTDARGVSANPYVEISASGAVEAPAVIVQHSGVCVCRVGTTLAGARVYMFGGTFHQQQGGMDNLLLHGGTVIYDSSDPSTSVWQFGGTFDTTRTPSARTITNYYHFGGELLRSPQTTIAAYKDLRVSRSPGK